MWVLKAKLTALGVLDKLKARLVARGFSQREGRDYWSTFAPVMKLDTLRLVIAIAVRFGLRLGQADFVTAFLNGDMDCELYISLPEGVSPPSGGDSLKWVCRLRKALYGLKQAPRLWHQRLDLLLRMELGFTQCAGSDVCLYFKTTEDGMCLIAVWVDDCIIAYPSASIWESTLRSLSQRFRLTSSPMLTQILGMRVTTASDGISWVRLDHEHYSRRLLEQFNMVDCNPRNTPRDYAVKLTVKDCPEHKSDESINMKEVPYRSAVGALNHLAVTTRPDISHSVGQVARYGHNPGRLHWVAVKHILRYLRGTLNLGICFSRDQCHMPLTGWCDSDWAGDIDQFRSTSGNVFTLCGGPVSWLSKLQPVVALSTAEAEYMALSICVQQACWFRNVLSELGLIQLNHSIPINVDNAACKAIANDQVYHSRVKHMAIKYHFSRECVSNNIVSLFKVPSVDNLGDLFTKAARPAIFIRLRKIFMHEKLD
jgi:hypothetical protein